MSITLNTSPKARTPTQRQAVAIHTHVGTWYTPIPEGDPVPKTLEAARALPGPDSPIPPANWHIVATFSEPRHTRFVRVISKQHGSIYVPIPEDVELPQPFTVADLITLHLGNPRLWIDTARDQYVAATIILKE